MYTQSKHKELKDCLAMIRGEVEKISSAQYNKGFYVHDKLDSIDSKLDNISTYLSNLLELMSSQQQILIDTLKKSQEVKKVSSNISVTPANLLKYSNGGVVNANPVKGVEVKDSSNDGEVYQSPEEPVYKHFYYYDVEDETDGSHSKYSRLADIASDLGASDSAPHYAMVKGTLFLGRYRINKVDTDVKVNVLPHHESEEDEDDSIQIV